MNIIEGISRVQARDDEILAAIKKTNQLLTEIRNLLADLYAVQPGE